MHKRFLYLFLTALLLQGCGEPEEVYKTHARLANAGSLDGPYGIVDVYAEDTFGGRMGFGFGAVNGFPGKSADSGGLGVPSYIAGHWLKLNPDTNRAQAYFRIDSPIDSELAKKKIETLENYYQHYETLWPRMQFAVEGERAMLFFTLSCGSFSDCTPKENADPNGWVIKDPAGVVDAVLLFEGKGEYSPYPFPKSPKDSRDLGFNHPPGTRMVLRDVEDMDGTKVTDAVEMPVRFSLAWKTPINPDSDWKERQYQYAGIEGTIDDPKHQEEKIRAYRQGAFDGYLKHTRVIGILNGDDFKFVYIANCWNPDGDCNVKEDPENRWEYIPEFESYGVVLYRGKAQQSDVPLGFDAH